MTSHSKAMSENEKKLKKRIKDLEGAFWHVARHRDGRFCADNAECINCGLPINDPIHVKSIEGYRALLCNE